ncbi:zinc finger protein 277-like [Microcebus murinus]|uniref:zinc finger protein 277-like n=1 Tax=Microcebus murinus TaxID=30608 RepID=UPI003F6B0763
MTSSFIHVAANDKISPNFGGNCRAGFHTGYTDVHAYQQCSSVPLSPHPHQQLLFFVFLIKAILTGVRWHLNVFLICISLTISDAECFFIYLLSICMCFIEKCLLRSFACFYICIYGTRQFLQDGIPTDRSTG